MATRAPRSGARRRGGKTAPRTPRPPANALELALIEVERTLRALGVSHALVGGLAVSAHATPRTTRDVDLVVDVQDDDAAELLLSALQARGYRLCALVEQTRVKRLATARLEAPGGAAGGTLVDLLFASSGIEREIVQLAERHRLTPSLRLPIARIGHLLALKVLARDDRTRPQDLDDLRALLREADAAELALAGESLRLIDERGFSRRRRLLSSWAKLLREHERQP